MKSSIPIPIYGGTLHICIGNIAKKAKKHFKIEYQHNTKEWWAVCTRINYLNYLICFSKKAVEKYGNTAHEAKHFTNHLFADRGVKLDPENDEAECYFLGWAVSQIQTVFDSYLSDKAAKKAKRNKAK